MSNENDSSVATPDFGHDIKWPRGSEWRKWDLHFHTPSSYEYSNKGLSNEDLVTTLKAAGIAVVAVTDHHLIDVERVKHLQSLAGNDLTVLPGIELRTELGGSESVHIIGIFPENLDLVHIWTTVQGKLDLTESAVKDKGNDKVYVDFKEAAKVIHDLGGLVSVHAGKKSNSIENISNAQAFKRAVKKDLAEACIDILELGRPSDAED
jgi:predicted metal-dependent phosphoesterase TrpH